jgi:hypothetical protein
MALLLIVGNTEIGQGGAAAPSPVMGLLLAGTSSNIVKAIPSTTLRLISLAPSFHKTFVKAVPSTTLKLTTFVPAGTVAIPGVIVKAIPSTTLRLLTFSPVFVKTISKAIPSATLRLTSFAPVGVVAIAGQITKAIPSGYLTFTAFAPQFINTGTTTTTTVTRPAAGGGIRHRPQRLVIIGKKRYRVDSYDQEMYLLRKYLKEQNELLDEEVNRKENKKVTVRLLKSKIELTETRMTRVSEQWRINQENEDIMLMLVA